MPCHNNDVVSAREGSNMSPVTPAAAIALMLIATPALPQVTAPNAPSVPTAPVVAPPPPPAAEPPHGLYPHLNPAGIPECRKECTPVACPAGQSCAPYCYE